MPPKRPNPLPEIIIQQPLARISSFICKSVQLGHFMHPPFAATRGHPKSSTNQKHNAAVHRPSLSKRTERVGYWLRPGSGYSYNASSSCSDTMMTRAADASSSLNQQATDLEKHCTLRGGKPGNMGTFSYLKMKKSQCSGTWNSTRMQRTQLNSLKDHWLLYIPSALSY